MAEDIKPRVEDGVPWCDAGCPQGTDESRGVTFCAIDKLRRETFDCSIHFEVCPHAVRRMAVELEAWRSGRLYWVETEDLVLDENCQSHLDVAVDALMAEQEE